MAGYLALIGSGELSDSMAEVHRSLMARIGEPARPVFIDTPAGFELNVDLIDDKAVKYFRRNLNLDLAVARYRSEADSPAQIAEALTAIRRANYIFAGPGSASYAVRMWRDSKIWQAVMERWQDGAMLIFSSAAAITMGEFALPVYEIYKVGEPLHWIDGLNFLSKFGVRAAVVPHWNNNSGDQHDTRFCFMGAPRFAALETMLNNDAVVIGIDEYSGLCFDPATCKADVFGTGQVALRKHGHQTLFSKGQQISFDNNEVDAAPDVPLAASESLPVGDVDENAANNDITELRNRVQDAITVHDLEGAVNALVALSLVAGAGLEQGIYNRAELAVQALQAVIPHLANVTAAASVQDEHKSRQAALLDALIYARAELRKSKNWAASDQLRDQITALGYILADTPTGTTWSLA
jgi:cyanophycinase-like exopeptidase